MARVSYPLGFTTVSRVKTLVLHLEATRGREAAAELVRAVEIDPELLADETRAIPVATWLRALEHFAATCGRDEIAATWSSAIARSNLGALTRLLRGAGGLEAALDRLDDLGGADARTAHWTTVSSAPGRWHGRLTLAYDPGYEKDGLCALARAAELSALPSLFGFGRGGVELLASPGEGAPQEYVLTWRVPSLAAALGAAALVALVAAGGAHLSDPAHAWAIGGAFAAGGVVAALAWRRDRARRAESHAQRERIAALERSVALTEAASARPAGFLEGSVVAGKYRLGPRLGAGANGVIHRATRFADNARVAIKLLRAAVAHDTVASDRLRREAEALALAWHPNVVEAHDHGLLPDGTTYLVMEFLEGHSLATLLEGKGALSTAELAPIALAACDALGAVHAAGIVHRDVKPANLVLTGALDGEGRSGVKLIDFGIARVEWAETRLTSAGSPLGTPGYMSPEQERGAEVDARSDLYALGAVLYECLTGRLPPSSGQWRAARPLDERASGVERVVKELAPAWREVIERAMAPLPQERWADAKAMRGAIARAMEAGGSDEGRSRSGDLDPATATASDRPRVIDRE